MNNGKYNDVEENGSAYNYSADSSKTETTYNSDTGSRVQKNAFSTKKIVILVILGILLLSPIDFIPDFLPVVSQIDKIDDVGYLIGIVKMVYDMIKQKKAEKTPPTDWNV